jgi:D-alanine-D-alanine ligase
MQKKLNVLVLFDVPYAPPNGQDFREFMRGGEWRDERDVVRTLLKLGHAVKVFGIHNDIAPLVELVQAEKPDVVFNLCESFNADRKHEPNRTALLELLGVHYTGATPEGLSLCKDKGLTKKVLAFHDMRVPRFTVSSRNRPVRRTPKDFAFPGICKPLARESSEGIAHASIVRTEEECLERLKFLHERFDGDAIVEEFIDGRELYVGVLGNERLTVLPPTELHFKQLPEGAPRILTYRAKWDEAYRKKYGIDSESAKGLDKSTRDDIAETCRAAYRLLKLRGYARIDLRLNEAGECVILEVNPNPSIKKADDFAWAAKKAGIGYDELIERIVGLALAG